MVSYGLRFPESTYLPRKRVSPRKLTPITTAKMIARGLNMDTTRGPTLDKHQEVIPMRRTVATMPYGHHKKMIKTQNWTHSYLINVLIIKKTPISKCTLTWYMIATKPISGFGIQVFLSSTRITEYAAVRAALKKER